MLGKFELSGITTQMTCAAATPLVHSGFDALSFHSGLRQHHVSRCDTQTVQSGSTAITMFQLICLGYTYDFWTILG